MFKEVYEVTEVREDYEKIRKDEISEKDMDELNKIAEEAWNIAKKYED